MSASSKYDPSLSFLSPEVSALKVKLDAFVENECIPAEAEYESHIASRSGADRWTLSAVPACMDRLKRRAQKLGLWNLFVPPRLLSHVPIALQPSISLSYREYGVLCESLGRCASIAPEACNSSAPDTGNMEVLMEFGTPYQKERYLLPLLRGEIRSCFCMTEPEVASSDPTNLQTCLSTRGGNSSNSHMLLNGRKWWSTGAMDPRCRVALVVARLEDESTNPHSDPHGAHVIVAVPLPHPGVRMERALTVAGYDDAPHGHAEVVFTNVRLSVDDLIPGSGFQVAQARLGPGRIHHCMRAIGIAARCYELMLQRTLERKTFGNFLWEHGVTQEILSESVADLTAARLLTLNCAAAMDRDGIRSSRLQIAMIKVAVPRLTHQVVDRAVQVFGGAGLSQDTILAQALVALRSLRIADGPDAVHHRTVARLEVRRVQKRHPKKIFSRL